MGGKSSFFYTQNNVLTFPLLFVVSCLCALVFFFAMCNFLVPLRSAHQHSDAERKKRFENLETFLIFPGLLLFEKKREETLASQCTVFPFAMFYLTARLALSNGRLCSSRFLFFCFHCRRSSKLCMCVSEDGEEIGRGGVGCEA